MVDMTVAIMGGFVVLCLAALAYELVNGYRLGQKEK